MTSEFRKNGKIGMTMLQGAKQPKERQRCPIVGSAYERIHVKMTYEFAKTEIIKLHCTKQPEVDAMD